MYIGKISSLLQCSKTSRGFLLILANACLTSSGKWYPAVKIMRHFCDWCILTNDLKERRFSDLKYKKERKTSLLDIVTEFRTFVLCSPFWSAPGLLWMVWNKESKRFLPKTILSATLNTLHNARYSEQTLLLREDGTTGLHRLSIFVLAERLISTCNNGQNYCISVF